jgi:NAD(P)-dependent dehydrogenase (short-subunit alcohol dehydrogenase family)
MKAHTLYLVSHTHTDFGCTDYAGILYRLHRKIIDRAIEMCGENAHLPDPARFRWTCEVSEITLDWLRHASGPQIDRFRTLHEAGLMGLVCVTLDPRSTGTRLLSWARWTEASRGIATTALLGLRYGGPLVQPGGAIVVVAAPGPSDPASEAAHGILLGLSRGASGGFAARGIRVNRVATDFTRNAADQAEAVAFLVSDAARFVTGADIGRGRQEER